MPAFLKRVQNMKKVSFRLLSVAMTFAIIFCCLVIPANGVVKKEITFTVLGDGIAYGNGVDTEYRYGDVIRNTLINDGYDVNYKNYSVPKYGSRSVFFDYSNDTFSSDNDIFVGLHGAPDYRNGVTFDEYTNQLKKSDFILINVGANDILAKFYNMRGYDNFYKFYYAENDSLIFENDVKNGKVDWIYSWNSKKAKEFEKRFEDSYSYYMEENIKNLLALNPDGQIIINNVFNPYKRVINNVDTFEKNLDLLQAQLLDLANSATLLSFVQKIVQLNETAKAVKTSGEAAFTSVFGTTIDECDGIDISNLRATQKLLYKIQYARMEKCAADMLRIANEVVERLCKEYGCIMADIENTDVCFNLVDDTVYPSVEGHKIIADVIYALMEK